MINISDSNRAKQWCTKHLSDGFCYTLNFALQKIARNPAENDWLPNRNLYTENVSAIEISTNCDQHHLKRRWERSQSCSTVLVPILFFCFSCNQQSFSYKHPSPTLYDVLSISNEEYKIYYVTITWIDQAVSFGWHKKTFENGKVLPDVHDGSTLVLSSSWRHIFNFGTRRGPGLPSRGLGLLQATCVPDSNWTTLARRGPGLPSTRTVKTTEQARFPLLQVMRGRSSNWKDVDDCASVSRQTFAGRVGVMSACKCSLFGRDKKPHDHPDSCFPQVPISSASWQQTIAHFLDFVFCLQSAEIIDQYYVDDSSIILDIIGKNSASRLVDGWDAEYEPPSDPNWETSGGNDFQLLA